VACAAVEAFLGELDAARVAAVAAEVEIPGRLEQVSTDPPVFLDAAHNPDGAAALAEALTALRFDRVRSLSGSAPQTANAPLKVVAVLAILADKDARAMVEALAPVLARAVCTEVPASRPSFPATDLARICREAGLPVEVEPELAAAVARGRELAREDGGAMLVAGSHYALGPARLALGLAGE